MIEILHYLKGPTLWKLWSIPYYGLRRIYTINRSGLEPGNHNKDIRLLISTTYMGVSEIGDPNIVP